MKDSGEGSRYVPKKDVWGGKFSVKVGTGRDPPWSTGPSTENPLT